MFRCQHCGTVVPPRVSAQRHVVETRPSVYPYRREANTPKVLKHGSWKYEDRDDPGGVGREIAREIQVCPACRRQLVSGSSH